MNKIIRLQDLPGHDFRNLWELRNPKFSQAPEGSQEALPQFKLRHSGSVVSFMSNYLTPSRLFGFRKFFAGLLWLFIMLLIFGTVFAYGTGSGEMGQIYFTLFFIAAYLILFIKAGNSRLRGWDEIYTKTVKTDVATHTKPAIIYDGQDILLANERIFEWIGERPIAAFVDDYQDQLKHIEKEVLKTRKAEAKEKARLKKEKEDREFKEALEKVGPLIGSGLKSLVKEGGVSTRAAQSARGILQTDSLSSRAAKVARGTSSSATDSNLPSSSRSGDIKIEGFTGSYWETCATGLDNNANYIARRMKQIRKSNARYTKLRAVDGQGRFIDVG